MNAMRECELSIGDVVGLDFLPFVGRRARWEYAISTDDRHVVRRKAMADGFRYEAAVIDGTPGKCRRFMPWANEVPSHLGFVALS